jgi:DNA-binding protein H-NS
MNDKMPSTAELDALTVPELRALADSAMAAAVKKTEAAKQAVLAETRAKLAELGVDFDGLLKAPLPKKGKVAVHTETRLPIKFRGPKGEAWTGRGKLPQWLANAEKQGRSREEFKV